MAKMSRDEESDRKVGALVAGPAAMSSVPVPYRHFRQDKREVPWTLLLLAGGCPSGRVRGRRHCSALLCMRPGEQGTSLIDKSNVGRFDCVPSTCMHFPRLSGVFKARGTKRAGRLEGRVLHSLACAGCDVEQQQQVHLSSGLSKCEMLPGRVVVGGQCRRSFPNQ